MTSQKISEKKALFSSKTMDFGRDRAHANPGAGKTCSRGPSDLKWPRVCGRPAGGNESYQKSEEDANKIKE